MARLMDTPANRVLARMDKAELRLCVQFNRGVRKAGLRRLTSLKMAIAGLTGLLLYKLLKRHLVRERPFITHQSIVRAAAPLDRFSFPSGHTLHAVCFTVIAVEAFPVLAWVLVPLALLIAASRVVLGLHYPTDVLAGAALGEGIARATQYLPIS
jgi:undecaprenyl-diphosphatase